MTQQVLDNKDLQAHKDQGVFQGLKVLLDYLDRMEKKALEEKEEMLDPGDKGDLREYQEKLVSLGLQG